MWCGPSQSEHSPEYKFYQETFCVIDTTYRFFRTPEKPLSDIQQSEVYKMCQAADAKGKPINGVQRDDHEPDEDRERVPEVFMPAPSRGKGLSFKVLQWLTDTADDDENDAEVESTCMSKLEKVSKALFCQLLFNLT